MRTFILILSFFITHAISAQNEDPQVQHSIKLYNLITWERNHVDRPYLNPTHQRETDRLKLLHPTIAYNWRNKNGHAQEIELMDLSHQMTDTYTTVSNDTTGEAQQILHGASTLEMRIAFRYEYMLQFNRAGISRWTPSIGAAIAPYFDHYRELPLISVVFPTNEQRYGAMFFIVPRISYRISDRFHFDLNIPVCVSDTYFMTEHQFDPNLSAGRKVTSFNFQGFPSFHSLRAGIGVRL